MDKYLEAYLKRNGGQKAAAQQTTAQKTTTAKTQQTAAPKAQSVQQQDDPFLTAYLQRQEAASHQHAADETMAQRFAESKPLVSQFNGVMNINPSGGQPVPAVGVNPAKDTSRYFDSIYNNADKRVSGLGHGGDSPYRDYMARQDYAEKSQASGSKLSWMPWKNDLLYNYINDINGERERQDLSIAAREGNADYAKYAFMTEDEIGVYNYLYATEGKKAANQFLKDLEPELNKQWYSGASNFAQQQAVEHPLLYSLATLAAQPARMMTSGLALGQDLIRGVTDQEIDPYSPLRQASRITSDVRNAIGENSRMFQNMAMYNPDMQNAALTYEQFSNSGQENPFTPENIDTETARQLGSFAYQTVMSAMDSAVNGIMAQGYASALPGMNLSTTEGVDKLMKATNVIGALTMSSEVASLGVAEAKEKGYSDTGALAVGLVRGAIEYASEAIGGEWAIRNIKQDPLNFFKTMLRNMVPEGVEEVMSDVGNEAFNLIIDAIFGTEESEIRAMLRHYEQEGTDWERENPWLALVRDIVWNETKSFLGGALATFGTTGVQTVNFNRGVNATSQRLGTSAQNVVQLMQDYQTESPGEIYEMADRLNARNEAELRQKAGEGSKAADVLEKARKADEANKDKFEGIARTFRNAGIALTGSEIRALNNDMSMGTADADTYQMAALDAFRLGARGDFTLAEAIRATDSAAKITEDQFRHAFELGQARSGQTVEETAETNAENRQQRLDAALAALGEENVSLAAQAYQEGQDIDTYAAAMQKAAALYAANGQDLRAIVQQARSGQRQDIVGRLTDAQVETAIQIGQRLAAQRAEGVQQTSEKFRQLREKAAAQQKPVVKGGVTIATEAGEIPNSGGMKYEAVDESKLSQRQKSIVSAVSAVADTLGLNVTVVSGRGNFGGAYSGGGKIYLNINSGMNLRGFSKAIAAGSFAHEMTHWLRQYAETEFEALKNIVTGHLSAEQLDALVQEQLKSEPNLSYDEALEEVIANACQPLLKDSKAFEQIARENMTLAEKILDFLKEFTQKIHDAFAEVDFKDDIPIYNAVKAMEDHLDEMQEAFDKAILAARENMAAERAAGENKNTAGEGGAKLQAFSTADNGLANDGLIPYDSELAGYITARGDVIVDSYETLKEQVYLAFEKPNEKHTLYFGNIPAETLRGIEQDVSNLPKRLNGRLFKEGRTYSLMATLDSVRHVNEEGIYTTEEVLQYMDRYADTVLDHDEVSYSEYTDNRGNKLDGLRFKKVFPDGLQVVYDIVSNRKRGLSLQTNYGGQKTKSASTPLLQNAGATTPEIGVTTPEARGSQTSSADNIAETGGTVKSDPRVAAGTESRLQEVGSTATDGVVVSDDLATLMREEGFSKPVDPMDQLDAQYQVWTTDDWESNYLTSGGDLTVAAQIRDFTNAMLANDAIMGYVPAGHYQKSRFGPLRKNIEYRWTFDMDASCPRTFQFVNYRNALQTIAGRPLTDSEAMNLLYLMRRMNQQIPCTYCYVENKRVMKSKSYLDWFQARADVMSATTDEEALKKMYSYDAKKGTVGAAAQKVFDEWRADVKAGKAYYPTAQEVWTGWNTAKNTVFNFLDKGLKNGVIRFGEGVRKATTQKKMVDAVCKQFGITDKAARREIEGFVAKWRYDVLAGVSHVYDVTNDTGVTTINQDILRLNRLASNYASSVSQARLVDDYIPYTDQLKNVSAADKAYIMGMGGIRKHSSNDFRMDYVQDYLLFYADLAAGGWTGHTYTKSVDYCKVFGRTGDRINLSIAMNTENGKIVENQQEGAAWKDARELRKAYKDLGVMAMVTDNAQLSFALNTEWIDMCIPFHASGLPKAVWYNLRAWSDYTSVQLESYFTTEEMRQRLKDAGVNIKGLKTEEVEALFNSTFNIPVILNKNGQRVKPHFFPSDTVIEGPGGVKQVIPGHHNDAQRYFELCEQYGVHPRFYGVKVTDAGGNVIDVTDHPNYVKLIKETSRTDTEQEPIKFNFNERDEYLGMTPMEYAMQRMQEEAKIGGYKNTAADPLGIVDMFKELYLGKDRDIGWMPADTDESPAAERLRTALEITQSAYNEMYDADVQTLDTEGYQKVLTQQTGQKGGTHLQVWDEGAVYNDRALVSEETLDKWMSSGWYGSSNPDYAQAYITSMSPSQFLKLTTLYDEGRVRTETTDNSIDRVMASSESQPIQLMIDTETGKVVGHEGRHRMVVLERNGVYEVPVLLFDSSNKYSKKAMKEFVLHGQDFHGQNNYQQATVFDVYPLNKSHRQQIVNAYSKQTFSEGFKERNNGARTVRFQQWDMTDDDTAAERRGRQSAYARLQSENAVLRQTVRELKRTVGKQNTTLANIQKQLQLTKTPETRLSDAKKLARALIKEAGSKSADGNVAAAIKGLGDYILNTTADQLSEEELKNRARVIARDILEGAAVKMTFDEYSDEYSMEVNPYDQYMGEAVEDMANRIVMDAMNGVLRETQPTKADKQQARTQAMKDRVQQLKAEDKLSQKEAANLYRTVYDLSLALDKAQSRYETLRQDANLRLAQVRAEGAARAAEIKANERARAEGLLEEQKQYYLDIARRARERRNNAISARTYRQRIMKLYKEFVREIQHPTEARHIPPALMKQATEILAALNMDNSREGSKAGQRLREKLAALKTAYDAVQRDPDFRSAAVYDPIVSEMMQMMIEQVGDTPINQMSVQQLEIVYNVLKAMQVTARKAMKIQLGNEERDAYQTSVQMTNETRSSPNKTGTGLFARYINSQLSPERMFNRLGGYHKDSTWSRVYQMLNGGQLKATQIFVEGSRIFEKLLSGKDYDAFVNPKNAVDIGLKDENGNAVQLTHGMLVSLYMHLQNEDNTRHAILGGVEVPALKDYYNGKKTRGTERAVRVGGLSLEAVRHIDELREQLKNTENPMEQRSIQDEINEATEEALAYAGELRSQIESKLTDYDRQWVSALKTLFDQFSKDQINATTMNVYGIKKASVDNYYPIWVDGDFLNTPFESIARDFSIENAGFLKERVTSNKPIRLADASEVASAQLKKVSQYCGLMPVIRDFNKIWGKSQRSYSDSLKKAVHSVFGQTGVQYIDNLMADLNGARTQDDGFGGEFFNRIRGHMAQAALTLSMRTAFGQTASYPTAAAVVGWGPLLKALAKGGKNNTVISRADQQLIEKYSPLLAYRMKGYSSIELGDIASSNSRMDRLWKKMRWATGWIQAMDGATVGRLWYAAEYYVQDHNGDLQKGTDEYYQEVAKVFNDIVEKTQPNYTTMQRPDILRNPNALVRSLTMFLTQRLQNTNILFDAAATLSQAKKDYAAGRFGVTKEDVHQAAVDTRRAVVSQLVAAATIVAFKFAADAVLHSMNAYRDDETGEITDESKGLQLLNMFLDSLIGNYLWGGELYDLVESRVFGKNYYGIEVSAISTVTDMVESFNNLLTEVSKNGFRGDKTDGKQDNNFAKRLNAFAKNLSSVLGIPLANAEKIVSGIVNHFRDAANGEFLSFNSGYDFTTRQRANQLINAYESGDTEAVNKILSEFEDKDKAIAAVKAQLKDDLGSGERTEKEVSDLLKKTGMSSNDVFFLVKKWTTGDDGKYTAVKRAALAGSRTSFQSAMRELTNHGIKEKEVQSQVKAFLRRAFLGTELSDEEAEILGGKVLSDAEARRLLHDYAGMSVDDATELVREWQFQKKNGWAWSERKERYQTGAIQKSEILRLLQSHGGMTAEEAGHQLEVWDWQKEVPGAENISYAAIDKYNTYCRAAGVGRDIYVQAWKKANATENDVDPNGRSVPYSAVKKIMEYINSLPISPEQKTAIALSFWKDKTVRKYKLWN